MQDPATSESTLIFGKYRIIKRLAIGGMGEIFLARQSDTLIDRYVILKSLLPDLAANQSFVEQFLGEARVAATLNHPHIVSIYEVGAWDGIYFIAMEYIDGPDLAKLLGAAVRARRLIPPPLAAKIALDAATALEHATEARDADGNPLNIVHRDISPQNVMLRRDGVTKVVDFGIARAANLASRTLTGQVKGKLAYMPPEQLLGEKVDWRADQYALGVVLWELSTCERLIKPGTAHLELIETTTKYPMQSPREVEPDVAEELETIILRMGERDPDKRYQSWSEVRGDLRTFIEGAGQSTSQDELAAFIGEVAGEELEKAIRSEEAASPENFLINLKAGATVQLGGTNPDDVATMAEDPIAARTRVSTPPKTDVPLEATRVVGGQSEVILTQVRRPAPWRRSVLLACSLLVGVGAMGFYAAFSEEESQPETGAMTDLPTESELLEVPEVPPPPPPPPPDNQPLVEKSAATPTEKRTPKASSKPKVPAATTKNAAATEPAQPTRVRERPQGEGVVTLNTHPWTQVLIDGSPSGTTPIYQQRMTAGKHKVQLVNQEMDIQHEVWIDVGTDEKRKLEWVHDPVTGKMVLIRDWITTKDGKTERRIGER